jgi:hypothetical protein
MPAPTMPTPKPNAMLATWVYQDSDKKKRGGAGYFPVVG